MGPLACVTGRTAWLLGDILAAVDDCGVDL
jgi:hypothetical protein